MAFLESSSALERLEFGFKWPCDIPSPKCYFAESKHTHPSHHSFSFRWCEVLDDKIVLLDETHHLLHPGRYSKQLDSLGACLLTAKRTVAVGFTGTLVLDEASEGQKLLDIIKGGKGTCDEGALRCKTGLEGERLQISLIYIQYCYSILW